MNRQAILERIMTEVSVRSDKVSLGELVDDVNAKLPRYCEATGWTKGDRSGRTIWVKRKHEVWEVNLADPPYRARYFAAIGIEDIANCEGRPFLVVLADVLEHA